MQGRRAGDVRARALSAGERATRLDSAGTRPVPPNASNPYRSAMTRAHDSSGRPPGRRGERRERAAAPSHPYRSTMSARPALGAMNGEGRRAPRRIDGRRCARGSEMDRRASG
ncbi:hypothetical protein WS62_25390 [Burkholderia sp. ABCPW 14]|nr:hypothetical protein WS62_25390 [Burkholderia sp. ABCPW 14]